MAIKTFNIDEQVYRKFSESCREYGISMSKQVEMFMRSQTEKEETARQEYLQKSESLRRIHEATVELSRKAKARGFDGSMITREERDKAAREYVKKHGIKVNW